MKTYGNKDHASQKLFVARNAARLGAGLQETTHAYWSAQLMNGTRPFRLIVGISGATGIALGVRALELARAAAVEIRTA